MVEENFSSEESPKKLFIIIIIIIIIVFLLYLWVSDLLKVNEELCRPVCSQTLYCVRFQVLTAASMKMIAFWHIALCSLVVIDRRFRGAYCLHHHGDYGGSTHLRNVGLL
jgi:uncharacterized membrane protein (DUF106 family)